MKIYSLHQLPKSLLPLIVICVITIISFATFTAFIGGDALNGKIENGHFFVRQSVPYKEAPFSVYTASALLCFLASIAFFLLGNRILFTLEVIGILKSKPALRKTLNALFGAICGSIAIYSVLVIWRAVCEVMKA